MPPEPSETRPRQFRLTDETMAAMDRIMAHHGLSSWTEVVRFLVRQEDNRIPKPVKRGRPKGKPTP